MNQIAIDQLNALRSDIENRRMNGTLDRRYIEDSIEDFLILSYVFGTRQVNEDIQTDIEPNLTEMDKQMKVKFDGKDWRDRIREYSDTDDITLSDIDKILRVAETDGHRIFNAAELETAFESGKKLDKQWITQMDDLVRETHDYLLYEKVPMDAEFYTFDGDHTLYPGNFTLPQNNVNCRCYLRFSTAE